MERNPLHAYGPYPELVEPELRREPYRIEDSRGDVRVPSAGMVDLDSRTLWVPLDAHSRAVVRHELGHVRWSRPLAEPPPFDPRIFLAIEDARVNLGLARAGLPVVLDAESRAQVAMLVARDAKEGDAFALFVRGIASIGTSVAPDVLRQLRDDAGPLGERAAAWVDRSERALRAARARSGGPVAPPERALALAHELARELRALGLLDAKLRAASRTRSGCCVATSGTGAPPLGRGVRARRGGSDAEGGAAAPGRLTIETAPLSVPLRARGGLRSWRASCEGSIVRYPYRWPVDGAIFRRPARRCGGTILIDRSGSMSLTPDQLDRLLLATPPRTRVAIYSGVESSGTLRIVALGTRRAAPDHLVTPGRGNIVDLPALAWLARQPAPRVWVSDGGVTGIGDVPSSALTARCAALCRRARIRRVAKLDAAAALLGART